MDVDRERIQQKIAYIKEQVSDIKALTASNSRESILNNKWLLKGIKYSLQTAIEAQIDIAYHIAAKKFNKAPSNAREAFACLVENKVISLSDLEEYSAMIGFRNRVVHGYQDISNERLVDMSINELESFESFVIKIKNIMS